MKLKTKKEVAKWLKETAYAMAKRDEAECACLFLDEYNHDYALAVGWLGGYDPQDGSKDFYSKKPEGYALNAEIVIYNPADCCDLEYMLMPYNEETGEVNDTGCTLGEDTDWEQMADFYLKEFKALMEEVEAKEAAEEEAAA